MQSDHFLLAAAPHLSSRWRRQYVERLTGWFAAHHRDLPWRQTHDPYAIWLSESMLQQTQVATVIDYYHRFLERFPSVQSLAEAEEADVLGLWAGLGYYRRARQLHAAARQVVTDHNGQFSDDVQVLMTLPGIGRYTAGAIVSIAFDKPAPIVEANTERLFARLLCLKESPRSTGGSALLWQFAQWQLPRGPGPGARQINQAAMELGSLICKPLKPLCTKCPLVSQCPTAMLGLQATIPLPKPKKEFTSLHHVALLIEQKDHWLIRMNPPGAWWTGLWDFPRVDVTTPEGVNTQSTTALDTIACERIEAAAMEQLGLIMQAGAPLFSLSHGVTRYRIKLDCIQATYAHISDSGERADSHRPTQLRGSRPVDSPILAPDGWRWSTRDEIAQLPLTAPARKILNRLPP